MNCCVILASRSIQFCLLPDSQMPQHYCGGCFLRIQQISHDDWLMSDVVGPIMGYSAMEKSKKKQLYLCWEFPLIEQTNLPHQYAKSKPNIICCDCIHIVVQFFCIFFAFMSVVLASVFHSSHRSWDNNKLTNEFNILGAHLPFRAHVNIYWFDMTLFCNNYLERNIWHGQWHAPHITHTVCV